MEHFLSPISSGHVRSDAHQSQIIGGYADVDHTQTIGWDTVKLLGAIYPPIPPGFRHPWLWSVRPQVLNLDKNAISFSTLLHATV